ncbi:MAG: DUF4058 family protein [Anaerolineae bacterium]|nr:DUF4058 family protein [Anaerolineae bacterium]
MSAATEPRLSPFPGMDPYLENPDIWPDFHDRLAAAMSSVLNTALPDHYYARLQSRPELGIVMHQGRARRINPDVTVVRTEMREARALYETGGAAVLELPRTQVSPAVEFRLPDDMFRHPFVEIRSSTGGHKLVTLIGILSPANKCPGPDRQAYESKQQEILASDAHLIEIDLLRYGRRVLPSFELERQVAELDPAYLILLSRSPRRGDYWIDFSSYPVSLHDMLPCIPVPLQAPDPDVLLDLQYLFNRVYAEGPYSRMIDYRVDPDPPLEDEDASWADRLLRAAGLRDEVELAAQ